MRHLPRSLLAFAGASALIAPSALGAPTAPVDLGAGGSGPDPLAVRSAGLDASAAWRDSLEAHRAPLLPTPGDSESAILLLAGPPSSAADATDRPAAARAIAARQRALETTLTSLGATVTFRYRVLLNAVAVRLPAGRMEALAALPEVRAIVPVTFLAPAQAADPPPAVPAPAGTPSPVAGRGPAHIALIDAGVDVSHPWLGGGMGPTFPIVGGADLVDGDDDPRPAAGADPRLEAHGTQMASIVLRSRALEGLAASQFPRLLAYRVVAPEPVGGRLRPLARTDRVLAALERAVDPDGDGATDDGAEVILLGLAEGFAGGGVDPVADALAAADRVGATVVAPAGNDGPTFARPGSVGGPAAGRTVIAAGALSAPAGPRTAALDVRIGPASARLGPLPIMGPEPSAAELRVVVVNDDAGISTGGTPEAFRSSEGISRVDGALVVLARGGGSIAETVARAADAGAAAVALWDEDGHAGFPAIPGDSSLALPTLGLGARQGSALVGLTRSDPGLAVALTRSPTREAPPDVASFSSWGPTPDGRQKPDVVAPGVDVTAAWPGSSSDGRPAAAPLTGTSAAAAEVAALALRLRVEQPSLGPRAVHSMVIQSAQPLADVALQRQGAGVVAAPVLRTVRIEPAIVAGRTRNGRMRASISLSLRGGDAGRYTVAFSGGASEEIVADDVLIDSGEARRVALRLPAGAVGRLVVRDTAGTLVASAPVLPLRPAPTAPDALGRPEVDTGDGLAEVRVRLGVLSRVEGRVRSIRVHGVRLLLVPQRGGAPLPVSGAKQGGAWPAGTYRFLVARRLASGLDVRPGRYRLRVVATGPDGAAVRRESRPFTLE